MSPPALRATATGMSKMLGSPIDSRYPRSLSKCWTRWFPVSATQKLPSDAKAIPPNARRTLPEVTTKSNCEPQDSRYLPAALKIQNLLSNPDGTQIRPSGATAGVPVASCAVAGPDTFQTSVSGPSDATCPSSGRSGAASSWAERVTDAEPADGDAEGVRRGWADRRSTVRTRRSAPGRPCSGSSRT